MSAAFPSPYEAPALVAGHGFFSCLTVDGELLTLNRTRAKQFLQEEPAPLVVHAPATARMLGMTLPGQPAPWFDLLELFAFVHPARSVAPTPRGLAIALGLGDFDGRRVEANTLPDLAARLLTDLRALKSTPAYPFLAALATRLAQTGWIWSGAVMEALEITGPVSREAMQPGEALRIWDQLPKWEDTARRPPPGSNPVTPAEARTRLGQILGPDAEIRVGQADFADVATHAFEPREGMGFPRVVLAEAGTGTGKTLGYIAPASLWAERNGGAVWISTYTRHLQRQIEAETARLHPDPAVRRNHVVVRKGRENYLCLLNMEEAVNIAPTRGPGPVIALALLARWGMATMEGDLFGGDLPGWFGDILGHGVLSATADRRGECIHGACPHYQRCFVEHSIRRAQDADLVIANHALVMAQAAWAQSQGLPALEQGDQPEAAPEEAVPDEDGIPTRYVFDEGHHLADAADGAFALELSGLEAAELRRWLLGAEGSRSRARGLRRRLDDLVAGNPRLETPLDAALLAAKALPAPGWSGRLWIEPQTEKPEEPPEPEDVTASLFPVPAPVQLVEPVIDNPTETVLRLLRDQVLARTVGNGPVRRNGSECDLHPMIDGLGEAADTLARALSRIAEPLRTLVNRLEDKLREDTDTLDTAARARIEAMIRSLQRRAIGRLDGWVSMLTTFCTPPDEVGPPQFIRFIRLEAREGQRRGEQDVGLHQHWLDPTLPFAAVLAAPAHGLLITSATLRDETDTDQSAEAEQIWEAAEARVGASHLPSPALRASLASPFDYSRQTRVFIVNDVAHDDPDTLAAAFQALFLASGGGGLGLFTAIERLRTVHRKIAAPLEEEGIPLYAQHVDAMDNTTLVDVFRTETDSCLLGTDAMRDGVDVPGHALRLVAFERVPWPRPDILHRERRMHLSQGNPRLYDDRLARLRLRQAFGRLIRTRTDRGVFVLLDRRTPSRLLSAFPSGVIPHRLGIAAAVEEIRTFFTEEN
ncbi:DNA helicase C2 [Acetobacter aceti NRIC 0242]|uniref:Helicase n=1 Tax=Acetobacter aceti NBRC 14818 TaxID=887700 RepID=A0AB33IFV5_ACEAC|nr:ATP-dependent DNA helicase [Acetobacter aceti]TCS30762.1 ATP-dependent DNA helicase DinG [Acetobacter aceti NBRC 14818]BCK75920.1 helicase [Acetobacter aceti NBRC 14818]GAN58521.1 DNA helicase C2 [Acetobacter aceti NBRC 14818]GBO81737.1 DNA helicase C2 [Acetobacter aceti NRIC 0242]